MLRALCVPVPEGKGRRPPVGAREGVPLEEGGKRGKGRRPPVGAREGVPVGAREGVPVGAREGGFGQGGRGGVPVGVGRRQEREVFRLRREGNGEGKAAGRRQGEKKSQKRRTEKMDFFPQLPEEAFLRVLEHASVKQAALLEETYQEEMRDVLRYAASLRAQDLDFPSSFSFAELEMAEEDPLFALFAHGDHPEYVMRRASTGDLKRAIKLALETGSDLSLQKLVELALERQGGAYNYTQRYFGSEELVTVLSNLDSFPVTLAFLLEHDNATDLFGAILLDAQFTSFLTKEERVELLSNDLIPFVKEYKPQVTGLVALRSYFPEALYKALRDVN